MGERTYKEIIEKANTLYTNVHKHGKNGISTGWAYYFSKAILNGKKNVKRIKQNKASSPTGESINVKLTKAEYSEVLKRYVKWVETNKKVPNYVTVKGKKVKPQVWTAFTAYLLKTYNDKGKLPDSYALKSNIYNSVSVIKKFGRSTKTGCDNRGQNTGYYCGPHMVQEIIRNLTGKVIPQSTLAGVIGTTSSGSDHNGLNTAFAWFNKKYGYNLVVEWFNFSDLGWSGIKSILESSNQDIGIHELYRDKWGHYTNYDKVNSSTVDVHNSLGNKCGASCYCGYTESRSQVDARRYLNGISQKSVLVVTRK